ncbi:MAG: vitamin B12 dependent methionine synthase, partial [Clostridia bacterium]|nr:vitamin B12 dependent methionine synthase [Clostridia bacterium]
EGDLVLLDGYSFRSALVAEKLAKAAAASNGTVVGYVMTCGRALYTALDEIKDDFFAAAIWDYIMIDYLRLAGDMVHQYMMTHFFPSSDGKKHFSALNPGSLVTWNIFGQKELFALLGDGAAAAGVELTDSMLMLPTKSGSGIFFYTEEPYENCMYCPRINCPNRRAEYAGDKK